MTLQLAVLASGNGSNLQAILDRIASGALDAKVCLVLCNKPEARALTRARAAGVAHLALSPADYPDREAFDAAMVAAIRAHGADAVALAGYMRLLTPGFLAAFAGRVVNIHPALLPSFPGLCGAADAQAYGVTLAGCTVHFVDEQMDHGSVIVQAAVPVHPGEPLDDLKARIHAMEHRIYPQSLQWLAEGRLRVEGRVVRVLPRGDGTTVPGVPDGPWLVWPPLEQGF
ncbi:phosphoribosylglycinamide formyltransferase [Nitratidesulfovibrio liaohensis]|uniref:Phosphoribosylglycinamide formyltransferase n=1 Tax=Nitratidesulfovibrio liaohensis TaxID=2604158 RepID=A0ABY9R2W9_9BACT|nr:phosphoribosylglycinamide formyltransferase [Nitratidesulfovibrio liaohensis]WMW65099.1 phosphoribosylglycinamide formyltransferase [Nitratidesulfovibrio liaohensis]